MRAAAGFVKGWLEAREIDVEDHDFNGLPVLTAAIGPRGAPAVVVSTATSTSCPAAPSSSPAAWRATA